MKTHLTHHGPSALAIALAAATDAGRASTTEVIRDNDAGADAPLPGHDGTTC